MFYELTPAYGRDYNSAKEVTKDFLAGKDFRGDYQMSFQLCSIADMEAGDTAILRYRHNTMLTTVRIKSAQ